MATFPQFKDVNQTKQFKKEGYVTMPFLSTTVCSDLINLYNNYKENSDEEFITTMKDSDIKKKTHINEVLCDVIEKKLSEIIKGYSPLFANFLIKKPLSTYKVGIHQDWSYVDESQFRSFNIWIALNDTNKNNGGLHVLPKSHLLPLPTRYTPFENNLKPFENIIRLKSKPLEVNIGSAVIYDSALIHFSNANRSSETRYAIGCVCIPYNAKPKHYFNENNKILEFEVNKSFFNSFIPGSRPESNIVKAIEVKKTSKLKLLFKILKL